MIEVERVSMVLGSGPQAFTALYDVSFIIAETEFITLPGPTGCSKTRAH